MRRAAVAAVAASLVMTCVAVAAGSTAAVGRSGPEPPTAAAAVTAADGPGAGGYWMLESNGAVHNFGESAAFGNAGLADATALAASPSGRGYWVMDSTGRIAAFGDASTTVPGSVPGRRAGERWTALAASPTGAGLWRFSNRGRVAATGDAGFFGDMSAVALNGPVIAAAVTPTGLGYYMVGSDGGIFAFGDAAFHGSIPQVLSVPLNEPVVGISPTPTNQGYWLVAADGGVFAFGDAQFVGSIPGVLPPGARLNRPINGMVAYGDAYLMVASDGGVFNFSSLEFLGSLGANPPPNPIVALTPFPPLVPVVTAVELDDLDSPRRAQFDLAPNPSGVSRVDVDLGPDGSASTITATTGAGDLVVVLGRDGDAELAVLPDGTVLEIVSVAGTIVTVLVTGPDGSQREIVVDGAAGQFTGAAATTVLAAPSGSDGAKGRLAGTVDAAALDGRLALPTQYIALVGDLRPRGLAGRTRPHFDVTCSNNDLRVDCTAVVERDRIAVQHTLAVPTDVARAADLTERCVARVHRSQRGVARTVKFGAVGTVAFLVGLPNIAAGLLVMTAVTGFSAGITLVVRAVGCRGLRDAVATVNEALSDGLYSSATTVVQLTHRSEPAWTIDQTPGPIVWQPALLARANQTAAPPAVYVATARPPRVTVPASVRTSLGRPVTIPVVVSNAVAPYVASIDWDGPGSGSAGGALTSQGSFDWTYAAAGTYTATVTVTDRRGVSTGHTVAVTIDQPPPIELPAADGGDQFAAVFEIEVRRTASNCFVRGPGENVDVTVRREIRVHANDLRFIDTNVGLAFITDGLDGATPGWQTFRTSPVGIGCGNFANRNVVAANLQVVRGVSMAAADAFLLGAVANPPGTPLGGGRYLVNEATISVPSCEIDPDAAAC